MNITPLKDRLLVKQIIDSEERVTKGGIIVPLSTPPPYLKGIILALGPGKKDKHGNYLPMDVSVGETILFHKFNGTRLTVDNEEYQLIDPVDIIAVIEEE